MWPARGMLGITTWKPITSNCVRALEGPDLVILGLDTLIDVPIAQQYAPATRADPNHSTRQSTKVPVPVVFHEQAVVIMTQLSTGYPNSGCPCRLFTIAIDAKRPQIRFYTYIRRCLSSD